MFKHGKIVDIAIIVTINRPHFEPAMKTVNLKYNDLLEKIIAPTVEKCKSLSDAAKLMGYTRMGNLVVALFEKAIDQAAKQNKIKLGANGKWIL